MFHEKQLRKRSERFQDRHFALERRKPKEECETLRYEDGAIWDGDRGRGKLGRGSRRNAPKLKLTVNLLHASPEEAKLK